MNQLRSNGNDNDSWWSKIKTATKKAIETGALSPIPTKSQIIEQSNIPFVVRIIDNLARKEKATKKQKKDKNFNPFLPYDENLYVGDITPSHVAILNKFNVVDHHLLIVTREFESQDDVLNIDDFSALWSVLSEMDGLAFYNGGKSAGSSQPHKHLQLVPYPLADGVKTAPIDNLILSNKKNEEIITLLEFPFVHKVAFLPSDENLSIDDLAQVSCELYLQLLKLVGISIEENKPSQHYNLLVTKEWMTIVPRSQESFANIPVNSLGFSGTFLVKNQEGLDKFKVYQPLDILKEVGVKIKVP